MSFLNSLLNEISGTSTHSGTPSAPRPRQRDNAAAVKREPTAKEEPTLKKEAVTSKEKSGTNGKSSGDSLVKRKADGDLNEARQKLVKKEGSSGDRSRQTSASATPPATAQPYKGTAGLDRTKLNARAARPLLSGPPQAAASSSPVARPPSKSAGSSAPQAAPAAQTASKKGSYAEMMARAAQNQKNLYTGIKHKATEKQKDIGKSAKTGSKHDAREQDKTHRLGSTEVQSGGESDKNADKKRKHTELSYKGTMRPAPKAPAYKGTMGMTRSKVDRNRLDERRRSLADSNRRYYDEYEDDEEEDEEQGYDDESDLSDMEANVFEVDEEESRATKIARNEDRREQELEAELKRKKQARQRAMMAQMEKDVIARREKRRLNGI